LTISNNYILIRAKAFLSNIFWYNNGVKKLFLIYFIIQCFTFFSETTMHNKGAGWDGQRYLTISKYGIEDLENRSSNWHVIQSYVPVVFYNIGIKLFGIPKHSSAVVKTMKIYTFILNILIFIFLYLILKRFTINIYTQIIVLIFYLFNYSILKWQNFDPVGRETTSVFLFLLGYWSFLKGFRFIYFSAVLLLFFNHIIISFGLVLIGILIPINSNIIVLNNNAVVVFIKKINLFLLTYRRKLTNSLLIVLITVCVISFGSIYKFTLNNLLYGFKPIFKCEFGVIITYLSNTFYVFLIIWYFIITVNRNPHKYLIVKEYKLFILSFILIIIDIMGQLYYQGSIEQLTSFGLIAGFGIKPFEYVFSHLFYWGLIFYFLVLYMKRIISLSSELSNFYAIFVALIFFGCCIISETRQIHAILFLLLPVLLKFVDNSKIKYMNITTLLALNLFLSRFYLNLNENETMYLATPGYFNSNFGYLIKIIISVIFIFIGSLFLFYENRRIKIKL
jgi:hypothetical protein